MEVFAFNLYISNFHLTDLDMRLYWQKSINLWVYSKVFSQTKRPIKKKEKKKHKYVFK